MSIFLTTALVYTFRTRDAVREIRKLKLPDRSAKGMLAEWFQVHGRATGIGGSKRAAYDQLLGREGNTRLRG